MGVCNTALREAVTMANGISDRRRRSVRLLHYDYGDAGAYFITLCVHHRACLFGAVVGGAMVLNDVGRIVAAEWHRTPVIRSQFALDEFIVMPNHFHAIVTLKSSRRGVLHTPSEKFHSPRRRSVPSCADLSFNDEIDK